MFQEMREPATLLNMLRSLHVSLDTQEIDFLKSNNTQVPGKNAVWIQSYASWLPWGLRDLLEPNSGSFPHEDVHTLGLACDFTGSGSNSSSRTADTECRQS